MAGTVTQYVAYHSEYEASSLPLVFADLDEHRRTLKGPGLRARLVGVP